ncbi:hypothetical protein Y695_03094 [Hydrogenophaga sp. T4]|nr:hypothetical protein Y695_03094 [Hydrogenophaga sp. T4]
MELHHEHRRSAQDAERQAHRGRTQRRIQDPVPGGLRCLPVGDDGFCRPHPARHHLPGAARLHVHAGPPDLRVRRTGGRGAHPGGAAQGRLQTVPGSAGRTGRPPQAPRVHAGRRHAQVPQLPGLHRQLRNRARLGHRLPRGLAGQGGRKVPARRTQPQAVGDVREEQLRLPLPDAARTPVHAQLEPGLHGVGTADGSATRQGPDRHPHLLGIPAGLPARGPGQTRGQAAARPPAQTRRNLLRPAAVLLRAAGRTGHRHRQVPAQRHHPAPDGDVPLLGLAERLVAPDPHAQLPVRQSQNRQRRRHRRWRLDVGRVAVGQGALHVPLLGGRGARHGLDLERHRQVRRRLEPDAGRQRSAARIFAQPPDLGRAAAVGCRCVPVQLGPDHRSGRLVRRARAHLQGASRRA